LLKEAQQSSEDDNNTNSQDQPVKPDADFNDRLKPDETTDSAWTTLFIPWADDSKRLLEDIEGNGDVITWQDLTTGESRQAVIEQVTFTRLTPPDKRFDGFGGVLQITIRTV